MAPGSYDAERKGRRQGAALLAALLALSPAPSHAAASTSDVIGIPTQYVTRQEDTLLDIAVSHDLGYVEIRAANPGVDPWLPGAGRGLVLPTAHVLPAAPHRGIVINLPELRLYYFPPEGPPQTFPIGIGGEGKETPVGRTRIVRKKAHPIWVPTKSEHAEEPDLPAVVPAGPDNPMGDYALYLGWSGYAIHGTNKSYSIGRRDSHGCIRLYPDDIARLYREVPVGTQVTVVNQQVKVGWSGGQLYLEVHPTQDDADALETDGAPDSTVAPDIDDLVAKAAGAAIGEVDWYTAHRVAQEQRGVAVVIARAN